MKLLVLLLTLISSVAMADEGTLIWDHPGVGIVGYRIYLDNTMLQEVTERTAVVTIPPKGGLFSVTAYSVTAESARSKTVGIPPAPTGIILTINFGG
mgnify:CR=1 FL=1